MLPSRSLKDGTRERERMSSAATICVACGTADTAFDIDDRRRQRSDACREASLSPWASAGSDGRRTWGIGVSKDAGRRQDSVTRGQPARGPQGSDKPHHNNRERALRGERSGRNRDESHRRGNMFKLQVWMKQDDCVDAADTPGVDGAMSLTRHGQKPSGRAMQMSDWDREELFGIAFSEPVGPASREAPNARSGAPALGQYSLSRGEPGRVRLRLGTPDMR